MIRLHGYWRSGTSYRVRIALHLKGVPFTQVSYDLRRGEHRAAPLRSLQPQALVPALEVDDATLIQSPAILEWLEERYPTPRLLPADATARAMVRAMAAIVACDIHPINNLRVLTSLRDDLGATEPQVQQWIARWIVSGFGAIESMIAQHGDGYAFGDALTLADVCLVPQVYSAVRFGVDLSPFPRLRSAAEAAAAHPAFVAAHPDRQPDADVR